MLIYLAYYKDIIFSSVVLCDFVIEDRRGKHEYIYNLDDTLQNIKDTGFSLRTRVYGPMRILELYRNSDELF